MSMLAFEPQTMADVERGREAFHRLRPAPCTPVVRLVRPPVDEAVPPPPAIEPDDLPKIEGIEFDLLPPKRISSDVRNMGEPTLADITRTVCSVFQICRRELVSCRRLKKLSDARHVAMYLAGTLTGCSYPKIGAHMGGRDHTTIMHGMRKIEKIVHGEPDSDLAIKVKICAAIILEEKA